MAILEAGEYNIVPVKYRTTFSGITFEVKVNDVALNLTDYEITAVFSVSDIKKHELNIDDGITIIDAANGIFQIDEIKDLDWYPTSYNYSIVFKNTSGELKEYIKGTFQIFK